VTGGASMGESRLATSVAFRVGPSHLRRLTAGDVPALQAMLVRCTDYFHVVYGHGPEPAEAEALLAARPEGLAPAHKWTFGVFEKNNLCGIVDALGDFPEKATWTLGLLLLDPTFRNRGLGRACYQAFETWAGSQGAVRVRLGVVTQNEGALRFWTRLGFAEEARRPYRGGACEGRLIVMSRPVAPRGRG
jgi:GNAT superfamily N-acetyltransferase